MGYSKNTARMAYGIFLLLGTFLYFLINIQAAVTGTLFDVLHTDFNVSATVISLFGSSYMYVYAFGQLAAGMFADRWGGMKTISIGTIPLVIGSLLFPWCENWICGIFCRALIGLGASYIYLSLVKEFSVTFKKNFATMLGLLLLIGYTGGIFAGAPFLMLSRIAGSWRNLLFAAGGFTFFCWLIMFFLRTLVKRQLLSESQSQLKMSETVKKVFTVNNIHIFILSWVSFGVYYVIQTVFGKKILEDLCRYSELSATWWVSVIGILSAIVSFLCPVLMHWSGNRYRLFVLICGLGVMFSCLGLAIMTGMETFSMLLPLLFCTLTAAANMIPIQVALLKETNSADILGVLVCVMNFGSYFAVALLGHIGGFIMDIFPPQISGETIEYGRNSYFCLFILLFAVSCCGAYSALKIDHTKITEEK